MPVLLNIPLVQKVTRKRERESSMTTTRSTGSRSRRKRRPGLGSRGAQAAEAAGHPGREERAGDWGGGRGRTPHLGMPRRRLLPGLGPRRLLPHGSHGLAARLFALLLLHAGCHVRRELLATDTRSLLPGQTRKPRLSPSKNYRLAFPRRQPHKLGQTPPTSGSVWRLHAAQAQ